MRNQFLCAGCYICNRKNTGYDLTYKRTSEQEMEVLTLLKDELTSDVMDELYNKAKKDTLCKNTFTSDLAYARDYGADTLFVCHE